MKPQKGLKSVLKLWLCPALLLLLGASARPAARTAAAATDISQLAAEAKAALSQPNPSKAIRDYQRLVRLAPRNGIFEEGLGIAYYTAGRPADAVEPLTQALKLAPTLGRDDVFKRFFGVSLAEADDCQKALPYLLKNPSAIRVTQLRRRVEMDGVKCSMTLSREGDALRFLSALHHDFPTDAAALYLTVHVYSDLSTSTAQTLLMKDPASYQVHELAAESFEARGKWNEAEQEYRRVLEIRPNMPEIHYLVGRDILSAPKTATTYADAAREFEAELKIDPVNAGAEFVLGEIDRKENHWNRAIQRFQMATKLNPDFSPAFMELGRTLVTAGKAPQAVKALQRAVKLSPTDPQGHYLLATAYRRAGRPAAANREISAYLRATQQAKKNLQHVRAGLLGRKAPSQVSPSSNP